MELLPDTKVKTYYSDGSTSTHTEGNAMNYIIIAIKLALLAAAACVFSFVCIFIMSYVTITAFKRNHDWSKAAAATQALAGKASVVAGIAGNMAKKVASKTADVVGEKIQQHKALKDGNTQDTEM